MGEPIVRPWPPEDGPDGPAGSGDPSDVLTDEEIDALDETEVRAALRRARDEQGGDGRPAGPPWGLLALAVGLAVLVLVQLQLRRATGSGLEILSTEQFDQLQESLRRTARVFTVAQGGLSVVGLVLAGVAAARSARWRVAAGVGGGLCAWWLVGYVGAALQVGFEF